MHVEAHLACGWLIANVSRLPSRRDRLLITLSAVAADADGLSYLFGTSAYADWHHVGGHNIFAAGLVVVLASVLTAQAKWWVMGLLALAGFASHWLGDYFLSGWALETFWPVSRSEVMFRPRIGLDHPINIALSYASLVFMAGSAWLFGRTPLEFVWPKLDALLVSMTRRRDKACAACGGKTNQVCAGCGQPVCLRHARVSTRMVVRCSACQASSLS